MSEYLTIENMAVTEYEVKRSRFIGYIKNVKTSEEAVSFVNEIKQKNYDARHNVFAYKIREGNIKRCSDDGEPQGTASIPVLEVIEKENLTDVCIVVTRYFGGILLGGGGLLRAYSHTAKLSVEASEKIIMSLCTEFEVECDYTFFSRLNSLICENGGTVMKADYSEGVKVLAYIKEEKYETIKAKIIDLSNGRFNSTEKDKKFLRI